MTITTQLLQPTLTGADERTNPDSLLCLDAEIGILYTQTPEGRNRYPRREWIKEVVAKLPRVALHVCGSGARRELISGGLDDILPRVQRIQVNGGVTVKEAEGLCGYFPLHVIITQHNQHNHHLLKVQAKNHVILLDSSGGRGLSPGDWTPPITEKHVGFAGGLGPDNLQAELVNIQPHAKRGSWIDMEGNLREMDWFCIPRARAVLDLFYASNSTTP